MTDNEIIKALECCQSRTTKRCGKCPLYEFDDCCTELPFNALKLINRQKAEIEEYKADKEEYISDYDKLENELKYSEEERKFEHQTVGQLRKEKESLEAKIASLLIENKRVHRLLFNSWERIEQLDKLNETIKAKAIKEFAERLEQKIHTTSKDVSLFSPYTFEIIGNLVKEMVGE